ncbi:hypothetical protein [Prevotella multiformis]|uniref:hypothetical protein n=1 Tax=Prevotella multiformis TaxID=282402 RepID=UPI003F9F9019
MSGIFPPFLHAEGGAAGTAGIRPFGGRSIKKQAVDRKKSMEILAVREKVLPLQSQFGNELNVHWDMV